MKRMYDSNELVIQNQDAQLQTLEADKIHANSITGTKISGTIGGGLYATTDFSEKGRVVQYEVTTGAPNMYLCNTSATPYIRTEKASTAPIHAYIQTSDKKNATILDDLNSPTEVARAMATTEIAGAIKSGTQQWISSASLSRNSTTIQNFVVHVQNGTDYWQGSFSLLPRNNRNYGGAKTSFIMPYSSTDYAVCQAYFIKDLSEGTVNALKINLDNMTLAEGYKVNVFWYDVVPQ